MHNDLGEKIQSIESALSYISPDDREIWIKMAMAIRSELGNDGYDIWDSWSQGWHKFNSRAALSVWKSIKDGGKVTIASLFGEAKNNGYVHRAPTYKPTKEEIEARRKEQERKALLAEQERQAEQALAADIAAAMWAAGAVATDDHPYLVRKGIKSHGLRVGKWELVNQQTGEITPISDNALLVPICDRTRKVHSLQAIFPTDKNPLRRDKDYLKGGAKRGMFHAIGTKPMQHDGRPVFVIEEGYATGASIHETTGHMVLVCFDTSNLLPVARAIRERVPNAIIIFGADNDQWTTKPNGEPYNPGVEAATKAAAEVSGLICVPQFADLSTQPTDFNDLHRLEGADAVRFQFDAVLNPPPEHQEPEPEPDYPAQYDEQQPEPDAEDDIGEIAESADFVINKHFTIIGYDHGKYFVYVHKKQQVLELTKSDFTEIGLSELAQINWWEERFPGPKGGVDRVAAANWIFEAAHRAGVYDPTRIRGRGAWKDEKRMVYHHGGYLTVDGVTMDLHKIKSTRHVYQLAKAMQAPTTKPMSDAEGTRLLEIAKMVRWTMPASSALLCGWVMLAPICGAMTWRPHIWLTGAAGSGKSTVMSKFCGSLTREIGRQFQGNSSEAGIRQCLKADALPVLIDELESNNDNEKRRVESIISLIRQSSSESQALTAKGTVTGTSLSFHIRSMFCLASINTNLPTKADIDRLTRLVIKAPDNKNPAASEAHWRKLEAELNAMDEDEEISGRLLARALALMPVIMENVRIFRRVAAGRFGTQREGDQFGTLMAGAWCLTHSTVATDQEAGDMIAAFDFREHREDAEMDDAMKALDAIMGAKIKVGTIGDLTVYELICESSSLYRKGMIEAGAAVNALARHGIRCEHNTGKLLFGMSVNNLKLLVKDMNFVTDLRGQLLRIQGAERVEKPMKFNGVTSRVISIPLGPLLMDETEKPI